MTKAEETKQYYEYEQLPEHIKKIMDTFDEEEGEYKECRRLLKEVERRGWTFDYYLDAVPFNFEKIDNFEIKKVEAIVLVMEDNGGQATFQQIYKQIGNYYPSFKPTKGGMGGVRGTVYREVNKGRTFKKVSEAKYALKNYEDTKKTKDLGDKSEHSLTAPDLTLENLDQFVWTGNYHRHPLQGDFFLTDGVQYVAEKARAFWLLTEIIMVQYEPDIAWQRRQIWTLNVKKNRGASLVCTDSKGNQISSIDIHSTNFPLPTITLWLEDKTFMLPSEERRREGAIFSFLDE